MVHTPSTSESIILDEGFQKKYPIGSYLDIVTEGNEKHYQCKIDSYAVLFGNKVQVGVTVMQSGEKDGKIGIITMDSKGKPALYFFDENHLHHRKKVAIITSISRAARPSHVTVKKHVDRVHGVVAGQNKAEAHA